MGYRFFEHTADIAVEIRERDLNELFISAAKAWKEAAAEDFTAMQPPQQHTISLSEISLEELLVGFLTELNYYLFTRRWIFDSVVSMNVRKADDEWALQCVISGEEYSPEKHILKEEIKAVTFHRMNIIYQSGVFSTIVVFDI